MCTSCLDGVTEEQSKKVVQVTKLKALMLFKLLGLTTEMTYYVHEVCIELWPLTGIWRLAQTYEKGTISHAKLLLLHRSTAYYRTKLGYLQELFNYDVLKYRVTISKQYGKVWLGDRWTIGKDVEGTGCGLIRDIILASARTVWGEQRKLGTLIGVKSWLEMGNSRQDD